MLRPTDLPGMRNEDRPLPGGLDPRRPPTRSTQPRSDKAIKLKKKKKKERKKERREGGKGKTIDRSWWNFLIHSCWGTRLRFSVTLKFTLLEGPRERERSGGAGRGNTIESACFARVYVRRRCACVAHGFSAVCTVH